MTIPNDFSQEERENLFLIEHLRKLYDTRTRDEQALHAIGAHLASSPGPTAPESVPGPGRSQKHQAPGAASFPLSFRPKAGSFALLAATLVVVLLTGSLAAMLIFLQHRSPDHGTSTHETSTLASSTPAATTPCTQAYPVSGTITSVTFGNGTLGAATTVGSALVNGPQGQYRGFLGGNFVLFFMKETSVFEQQGQECHSVSLASLKVGQHIRIQFDGSIMQSLPPQIVAQQLVIVPPGGSGS